MLQLVGFAVLLGVSKRIVAFRLTDLIFSDLNVSHSELTYKINVVM